MGRRLQSRRPMRVLHVYKSYYPDTVGGIEQVIAQLGRGLAGLGHESRIYTLSRDPHPAVVSRPEGEVHRSRTTVEIASNPASIRALADFREQLRWADVVHYQFPWPFADLLHLLWARGKPSIVSYQSDIVRQKLLLKAYTPLMDAFLGSVGMVVATSPNYQRSSPVLGRLRTPVRVIPNGIDETTYPEPPAALLDQWRHRVGEGFFMFVGVLRYYKGLHTLLEAARGFEGRVLIAGAGPEEGRLRAQIAESGIGNVTLLGQVSDEDKVCLLRLSRALVFPSHLRSEAFGMSLVEAAMYGKPMVSCEIGTGTTYINLDGVTGWTVPPEDAAAFRDAMQRLASEPQAAAAMGAAARARFESVFTAGHMARAYEQAYRDVAAATR
jgi:glycosyltransferase involved in cell wall biosynthesis